MEMPITRISVLLPDGHELTMIRGRADPETTIHGLSSGPCVITLAEAAGLQTMLNHIYGAKE